MGISVYQIQIYFYLTGCVQSFDMAKTLENIDVPNPSDIRSPKRTKKEDFVHASGSGSVMPEYVLEQIKYHEDKLLQLRTQYDQVH